MKKYILLLLTVLNSSNAMSTSVAGQIEPDKDLMFSRDTRTKTQVVSIQAYDLDCLSYYASNKKLARVVSFDGGGVRGIAPATWCSNFEHYTKKPMADLFNYFAGSSSGGMLATSLVIEDPNIPKKPRYTADDIVTLYNSKECGKMFTSRSFLGYLFKSKYETKSALSVYNHYFSNIKLSQIRSDCDLLVTYYNLTNNRPGFFKSNKAKDSSLARTHDFYLKDMIASTTATPAYFKEYNLYTAYKKDCPTKHKNSFIHAIDGGLVTNDPSICALAEGMSLYNLADAYLLVSMGTGKCVKEITPRGIFHWASNISTVLTKNSSDMFYHLLNKFSDASSKKPVFFSRLQFDLSVEHTEIDDTSHENISYIEHQAQHNDKALSKIKKLSKILANTTKPEREELIDTSQKLNNKNQFLEI